MDGIILKNSGSFPVASNLKAGELQGRADAADVNNWNRAWENSEDRDPSGRSQVLDQYF